ncbi:MAG: cobyrinate a,c-diamide synthase [Lachnospiraceae bacterium]|nr:cobyrinate a,c-diamide synthase [Lachnospiraceae bacterium]MDD3660314.1 cobyrinate a,c-diamide synthase [Lachnospiraceae bacterium]
MKYPRIMVAAPSSGSGKTQITCGLLQAFHNRGIQTGAFKIGPDYIDPMFHERVIGTTSRNLDLFFLSQDRVKELFCRHAGSYDLSVIEGVMGYYDGVDPLSTEASSYDIANITDTPVILVIDCHGAALSLIPVIQGMMSYRQDSHIAGVILNKMSEGLFYKMKDQIETEIGIPVLGYVPNRPDLVIQSRHLGLLMPNEIENCKETLQMYSDLLEKTVSIDKIFDIAKKAADLTTEEYCIPKQAGHVTLAVARDEAFCFYYQDNLELLQKMGAELVFFSPLHDHTLPDEIDGILFGGGYPELHAEALSANFKMLEEIRVRQRQGIPILAECGGFMYLHEEMEDLKHHRYRMAGIVQGTAYKTDSLKRFGYVTLECRKKNTLFQKGLTIRGHEFHVYDSTNPGNGFLAVRPRSKESWDCMVTDGTLAVGFPHLYYDSNPEFPYQFLIRCKEFQKERHSNVQ